MLNVALRFAGNTSFVVPMLVDTGADRCMFDVNLAEHIGVNPYMDGIEESATGIGGSEPVCIMPMTICLPQLECEYEEVMVQFKILPPGVAGMLGHEGFDKMRISFSRGEYFDILEF